MVTNETLQNQLSCYSDVDPAAAEKKIVSKLPSRVAL